VSAQPDQLRIFCAVELPADVRAKLMSHIDRLRKLVPDAQASWSRETNLHLTIKFIGNVDVDRVAKVSDACSRAVETLQPFPISISQTGSFPKSGSPRVLWIGIQDLTGGLSELHARLERECEVEGFPKEDRAFHPHLTIARIRNPAGARELAETHKQLQFEPLEIVVADLVVIRSELSSKGSRYTTLSRNRLGTG
jgi:RNA 2',3'-cyclic 3'-phosphodiesterase